MTDENRLPLGMKGGRRQSTWLSSEPQCSLKPWSSISSDNVSASFPLRICLSASWPGLPSGCASSQGVRVLRLGLVDLNPGRHHLAMPVPGDSSCLSPSACLCLVFVSVTHWGGSLASGNSLRGEVSVRGQEGEVAG